VRWKLVDENPQQSLFDDEELMDRHVGRGEFAGMEFLHVNAKRIINTIPAAAHLPFGNTINAYRGCSHACSYCVAGTTRVLLAMGGTKPIRELRAGDLVCGTDGDGAHRRRVPTRVVAHWKTRKRAWRTSLEDGTELVSSGDHRVLTSDGWRHVAHPPRCSEPSCRDPDEMTSFSPQVLRVADHLIAEDGRLLKVLSVEALGVDLPMYDMTTGTGDYIAEGIINHNCFARPTHDYLGLGIGEDFDRKIVVKVNAVERTRAEVSSPKWSGASIAMGTNTDPYQRCEGKYHLTRGIVGVLGQARNPFSILTKSTLILRDLDLLQAAAARTEVHTSFSIGTLDEEVWKLTEPGTPHPQRRVEAVAKLNEAGIPCGVLVAPVLPGLSDRPDQLRSVVEACADAGATSISAIPLHLRPGVRGHFMDWLRGARPDLVPLYDRLYGNRSYLPKAEQAAITDLVAGLRAERPRRKARRSANSGRPQVKMTPGGTNGQDRRSSS